MTEKQRKFFYFPAWNACCMANHWAMKKGYWVDTARRSDANFPEYAQIWALAGQRGRTHHRAPNMEDLRHACHILALGVDKSSEDLSNRELNRIVTLFRYLENPENLDHVMAWQNPEIADRRSLVQFIKKKAPEEYICKITRDKYKTIYWEDLDMPALQSLCGILSKRRADFHRPAPPPTVDELEPANIPF